MRRAFVIAFAVLGLSACGQQSDVPTEGAHGSSAAPAAAAKPDVSAGANRDTASCLDLVSGEKYDDAVPVCTRALNANPGDEKVKAALETATAKLSAAAGSKSY